MKNKKIKKNLSKVSYRMLYNFLNRNIYYSEYFVPDLNNYLEAEHKKSLHTMKKLLNLTLTKIPFLPY